MAKKITFIEKVIEAKKPVFIAEVKTKSPFGYESNKSWQQLFDIANLHGDWLSIHTNPRWGGSFEYIKEARLQSSKPILAKGLHENDKEIAKAIEYGANYVLVVGRIPSPSIAPFCLIEPYTIVSLYSVPSMYRAVWNTRDLKTGEAKERTFADARNVFDGWLCQASNIKSMADVNVQADAILVGQNLESFVESHQNHYKVLR